MDSYGSNTVGNGRRGARRRLRLRLGLWLLATAEGRSCDDAPRGSRRRLPSVRALATAAGVHRNTAAAAYRDLQRFGLVHSVRGAGTFAVESPARSWTQFGAPVCSDPGLAGVLSAELRRPVSVTTAGDRRRPLLVPLDESPPAGRRVVPVAPRGPALLALRRLSPGSTVHLVSDSPRLGRLVRHAILALHGESVGLARTQRARPAPELSGVGLGLIDLRQLSPRGTDVGLEGLIPLMLLIGSDRNAG
ncbi:MAG TPA: GntR family transcriptional regulator [Gemmatimonadota bacterium]|nr:GntR family transcriptional regulator [Gemmatimonadota bacterium]